MSTSVSHFPVLPPANGNRTTVTSAYTHWTFPMLRNEDMTSDEFELLKRRVRYECIEINRHFGRTFSNFFQSLHDRNVSIKKIVAEL